MTPQEKIQQLAMAALRSAPAPSGVPKPATFMADAEKLKAALPVTAAVPAPQVAAVPAPAPPAVAVEPMPQPAFKDEADPELRAMIESREKAMAKSLSRRSLAISFSVFGLLAAAGTWVAVSPTAQAKVARVVPLFQETVRDAKTIGTMTTQYDESLDKIGAHGKHIEDATQAMGGDPAAVGEGGNAVFDEEMGKMMGDDGRTTGDRDRELQSKLGVVKKLMGKE
jgi:hypothetical protein